MIETDTCRVKEKVIVADESKQCFKCGFTGRGRIARMEQYYSDRYPTGRSAELLCPACKTRFPN